MGRVVVWGARRAPPPLPPMRSAVGPTGARQGQHRRHRRRGQRWRQRRLQDHLLELAVGVAQTAGAPATASERCRAVPSRRARFSICKGTCLTELRRRLRHLTSKCPLVRCLPTLLTTMPPSLTSAVTSTTRRFTTTTPRSRSCPPRWSPCQFPWPAVWGVRWARPPACLPSPRGGWRAAEAALAV